MPKALDEIQNRAVAAVTLAKDAGAQDAWATAVRNRQVEYSWRNGKIEKVQDSTSRSLSLEIYADGKYSTHVTTDLRPDYLPSFVADAVELTRALEPDDYRKIPDPALFMNRPLVDLQVADPLLPPLTLEQRDAWCKEMDAIARADSRVISATSFSGDNHAIGGVASSNGFLGAWERTGVSIGTEITVQDEGDKRPEGWYETVSHHLSDIERASEVARKALERTLARLGTQKGPTGKLTVVVAAEAGPRLISALLGPAAAASVQQGRSFWANKIGAQIFSEALSMVDNPLLPKGLGSRLFDGEGISARSHPIVDAGTVRNLYVDTYYGRKLDMAPTTGSMSNLIVVPGVKSAEELIADAGSGIYVTSWLGGNSDPTTGDFSFGIRGHLIENGKVGRPIGETNVTGNLAMLFKNLAAVGNDPWPYSTIRVPTMLFKDVQTSGA
jgi:PmbA protein